MPLVTSSVLTLVAWVPPSWHAAADQTLEGLARAHPSRAILLMQREVEGAANGASDERPWSARGSLRPLGIDGVAAEVIAVDLPTRARGAASIVTRLLRPDLPVFLRWRGSLEPDQEQFRSLIELADRLIVDSSEWPDPDTGYAPLVECFEHAAVTDLAWRRLEPWRRAIANRWPHVCDLARIEVTGPSIEARLLAAWVRVRLEREVELTHHEAAQLAAVSLDGDDLPPPRFAKRSPSELLSSDLEQVSRDFVFEEAACALSSVTT